MLMGPLLSAEYNNWRFVSAGNYYDSAVIGQYNDISCIMCCIAIIAVFFMAYLECVRGQIMLEHEKQIY